MPVPNREIEQHASIQIGRGVITREPSWTGPILLVVSRTVLLMVGQAVVAGIFWLRKHPAPWMAAGPWWTVFGSIADVGCLLLLLHFTRAEGIRIRDLVGEVRLRHAKDVLVGLGYYALIFPVHLLSFVASSWLVYHAKGPHIPYGQLEGRVLPLWAVVYSLSAWWLVWSFTEETTYQAYVLPRMQTLLGGSRGALAIVVFWWSLQHCALPLIPDSRYIVWRFLAFVPGVSLTAIIYHRKRKLAPMVISQWPMDIAASVLTLHYW